MQSTALGIEIQTWLEMAVGLFLEGLMLGLIFHYMQKKAQEKSDKSLQSHLKQEDQKMRQLADMLRQQHAETARDLQDLSTRLAYAQRMRDRQQTQYTPDETKADIPDELKGAIGDLFKEAKERRGDK